MKRTKIDLESKDDPSSEEEDGTCSADEGDTSSSDEDVLSFDKRQDAKRWAKCNILPTLCDSDGSCWVPLLVNDERKEKPITRRASLEYDGKEWIWQTDETQGSPWNDDLTPKFDFPRDDNTHAYDTNVYAYADCLESEIDFILEKVSYDDIDRWNRCWESTLLYFQVWVQSSHKPRELEWDWVVADAGLRPFVNPKEEPMKFGRCYFADARAMCMRKILQHVNVEVFLNHMCDVFFLEGHESSNRYASGEEKLWNDLLPLDFLTNESKDHFVLAMALVTVQKDTDNEIKWVEIEILDSYVPHIGAAQRLISKLRNYFDDVPVFPNDIENTKAYWKRNFQSILDACIAIANDKYYDFGVKHINGFQELFDDIYFHHNTD